MHSADLHLHQTATSVGTSAIDEPRGRWHDQAQKKRLTEQLKKASWRQEAALNKRWFTLKRRCFAIVLRSLEEVLRSMLKATELARNELDEFERLQIDAGEASVD